MAGDGDESKVDVTDIRFATALSFGIGACISCQQLRQAGEDVATVPTIALTCQNRPTVLQVPLILAENYIL
ncbi:hypothetical protein IVZ55_27790 [Salmonella enterica subsp. enterica serovar Worthington]|nr:hypothetical protein [Salmonella enterica subsp. enterica serovar Worthington]